MASSASNVNMYEVLGSGTELTTIIHDSKPAYTGILAYEAIRKYAVDVLCAI
jgi:hypothetical protein